MTGWQEIEVIAARVAAEHGLKVLPRGMISVYETYHPEAKSDDARRIGLYVPGSPHALWVGFDAVEVAALDEFPLTDDARDAQEIVIRGLAVRLVRQVTGEGRAESRRRMRFGSVPDDVLQRQLDSAKSVVK